MSFERDYRNWKKGTTRSTPLERDCRMKETREIESKEKSARKEPDSIRSRSKPLERNRRVSEEAAQRSKETRESRKRLENLKTRSKPLERNERIS